MRVPFPYVERDRSSRRPALVVSHPVGADGALLWLVMITSARSGSWPGDVATGDDHAAFGLPVPCLIRTAKIVTLPFDAVEGLLGRLSPALLKQVREQLAANLALTDNA